MSEVKPPMEAISLHDAPKHTVKSLETKVDELMDTFDEFVKRSEKTMKALGERVQRVEQSMKSIEKKLEVLQDDVDGIICD